ncbi:MAG: acyltransferase [Flavobacteriaceae bacterium]|nr:acyltransferase [Flavobacteriaceae bacterium]
MHAFHINKNNFDFIRFSLAFIVMIAHIAVLVPGELYSEIQPYFKSEIAIHAFFILSGFLVSKSLAHTLTLRKYFIKRIRRIVPAYTFVVIFFGILLSSVSQFSPTEYFSSAQFWKYMSVNLLYQNYLQPCLPGVFENTNTMCAVNGALWTIKIEEAFYLLLPFLAFLNKKIFGKKWLFYLLVYIASILFFNILNHAGLHRFAKQLPGSLCYFSGGIVAFHFFEKIIPNLKLLFLPAILIFLIEYFFSDFVILRPAALTVIVLFIAYHFSFLNRFGKYGDFTYGTYIFHFPIIQLCVWFSLHTYWNRWTLMFFIIGITLICAVFSWKVIETKFISRNYLQRIESLDR